MIPNPTQIFLAHHLKNLKVIGDISEFCNDLVNCDQKSSTTCGFLNAYLHSRASKISEKVSGWSRLFEITFGIIQF
jgi:hypothetical protein